MKLVVYLLVFILVFVISGSLFVRLAPTDARRWHQPVEATESQDLTGGAIRVFEAEPDALARIDAAARALPRTDVIAGSVDDRRVTYRTRSKWIGFPDFTTVEYVDGQIRMFARLRFGRSDLGVNGKRLERLRAVAERG
ncbi:DUF1499 domain-containing protein [uncultured Tateyamaria sp.]|uniref:DUF1499 domain-containing protein n=1 Tax=uncultured Tateyamaria sp. TaxID=455651 RepID=UPI00261910FB|nr:DUF1499 domain-containing protein [uncultured Tateyamaria sp.]